MTHLSLYSGVGGASLAAHVAGFETVAFCEQDEYCRKVLARHWPGVPCFESDEDVTTDAFRDRGIEWPWLIEGGVPCQPHSIAGKVGRDSDPRDRWHEMRRIVADFRPTWCVLENVSHFLPYATGRVVPDLERLGYDCFPPLVYPVSLFGAPHQRYRCFVVAYAESSENDIGESRRVADSERRRQRGNATAGNGGSDGGSGVLADAEGHLRGASWNGGPDAFDGSREDVGHADRANSAARGAIGLRENGTGEGPALSGWGPVIARVGGAAPRTPTGMDGAGWPFATRWPIRAEWPAARGLPQREWEAPRLTSDKTDRVDRLKALGNLCVPAQVWPIFAAIAATTAHTGKGAGN